MNPVSFLRRLLGGRADAIDRRTRTLVELCESLIAEPAEYAGAALAREALAAYQAVAEQCRGEFFDVRARAYSPPREAVGNAAEASRLDPAPANLVRLQEAIE